LAKAMPAAMRVRQAHAAKADRFANQIYKRVAGLASLDAQTR
jgi:hypothetical protein